MNHWIFKCNEISKMVSDSMDQKLPFHIKLGIRMHLLVCKFCSRYRKHLLFLREVIDNKLIQEDLHESDIKLSSVKKDRMKEIIKNHCSHSK